MNSVFQRVMAEATRLTRGGELRGATAAIRAALRGAAVPPTPAPGDYTDVIDVQARAVEAREAGARHTDVESQPTGRAAPRADQFIAGSHTDANGKREYKLYVPPGYRGQALPLARRSSATPTPTCSPRSACTRACAPVRPGMRSRRSPR